MNAEQYAEEKKQLEAELAANTKARKAIKKRLAAVETLAGEGSETPAPAAQ